VKNLVAEAAYVGNRTAWLQAGGNLINYNMITPETYRALGIDITNPTDRTLLSSTITSSVAVARGFKKPYANYPDTGTVLQSLKPFPQYSGVGATWTPLGNSWYDALQMKVTKRNSHGLEATRVCFSKTLNSFNGNGNVLNRGDFKSLTPTTTGIGHDQPQLCDAVCRYHREKSVRAHRAGRLEHRFHPAILGCKFVGGPRVRQ
jgi:hypothetical protein